jgi:hypothetical protein
MRSECFGIELRNEIKPLRTVVEQWEIGRLFDALNKNAKSNITEVDVSTVAAADPLFGSNIKPAGSSISIPQDAARSIDTLINRCKKGCP